MGDGCVEKSAGVAGQLRIICERQGVHFLDAKDCEFNKVDFMHLTRKGHAQLAELLAKEVPGLIWAEHDFKSSALSIFSGIIIFIGFYWTLYYIFILIFYKISLSVFIILF